MKAFRAVALPLAFGLLVACDEPPKPPAPLPEPPRTEAAAAAPASSAVPAKPASEATSKLVPEVLPVTPTNPKPVTMPPERAAPPDKAPTVARVIPRSVEKPTANAKRESLPPVKLDLRLPDELVEDLQAGEALENPAEQTLLPPLFVEKPAEPGPYQLNGRLITNERVDDYWDSVEGAELQIEFRN
jgi:hypothetical protein